MGKEMIMFGNIEFEKGKIHQAKSLIFLEYVDINKTKQNKKKMSSMVSSSKNNYKYFIGYKKDDHKIKAFHIMLPKTNAYLKSCDGETNWT